MHLGDFSSKGVRISPVGCVPWFQGDEIPHFKPVLGFHDILLWILAYDLWIRIRIQDPDPAIFVIDLQDANKKIIF